jgi:hypothetical protein
MDDTEFYPTVSVPLFSFAIQVTVPSVYRDVGFTLTADRNRYTIIPVHRNCFGTYLLYDIYIYIFNRSWVDTQWQQYITNLHTNSTHNTEKGK